MYLTKKTYVQNWDHHPPEQRHEITVLRGGKPRPDIKPERISYIIEKVAYWRKANAIHKWFVDNVQDGKDDCRDYYVEHDKLQELVNACKQILAGTETVDGDIHTSTIYHSDGTVEEETKPGQVVANNYLAEKLLPTQGGFFFGSTNYDEYYLDDLKQTVEMLDPVLQEEGEFYYCSSW